MKARERKLLSVLLIALLLGGTGILVDIYRKKATLLKQRHGELELAMVEIDSLLEDREDWMARNDWLRANQPVFTSRELVDKQIFEEANARKVEGIEVSEIKLLEPLATPHYVQAGVSLTVTGSLEAVFSWVHTVQRPAEFRVVRNVRVVPDKDDNGRIRCSLELLRWYAPASS